MAYATVAELAGERAQVKKPISQLPTNILPLYHIVISKKKKKEKKGKIFNTSDLIQIMLLYSGTVKHIENKSTLQEKTQYLIIPH